jgi:hypothetical protein
MGQGSTDKALCGPVCAHPHMCILTVDCLIPTDVDDLDDVNHLDEHIARSVAVLLFASDQYFTSESCQNEMMLTLKWQRPFFLVHEACRKNGGKSWSDLVSDCSVKVLAGEQFGQLPAEYFIATSAGSNNRRPDVGRWAGKGWFTRVEKAPLLTVDLELANLIFDKQEPIMWHRMHDFQLLALIRRLQGTY